METVGAVNNIQSDMCVYTEYGDGRSGSYYSVRCVYIQNMETVGAVNNIQSIMCVYN